MSIRHIAGHFALAGVLTMGLASVSTTAAFADPGTSHSNQQDGCTHGNSNKPCVPDPQPNKGKDCQPHGNWGGINEDHCGFGDSGSGTAEG